MHSLLRTASILFVWLAAAMPASAAAKVFMTRDEALALAFPKAEIDRHTVFLTKAQEEAVEKLCGGALTAPIVYPYEARLEGKLMGYAYFDTHKVRTLRETLMVVVGPDHSIRRVEVLAFAEPQDYVPRASWYEQFQGRKLDDSLALKRGIKGVTGATLTAVATTKSARRVLAIHQVLHEPSAEVASR